MIKRMSIVVVAALGLSTVVGCRQPSPTGFERYIPDAAKAQEALDQVLSAWKKGEPIGPLTSNSTPITIEVADSTRRPGQRLIDYEVRGEVSGEGPRTFVVRLKLDNPAAEREVRYYLVGIDPLWVFRQEDYDSLVHWDVCSADDGGERQAVATVGEGSRHTNH